MIRLFCRNTIVAIVCLMLSGLAYPISASANFIATADYLAAEDRQARLERVQAALMQERISARLTELGVDPAQATQRVAALSDSELVQLDEKFQELPAGAGALEVVLLVFLLLLILDLTGVTNVFPTIGPGKT
ncbi:MAG: PA2779 family protein [Chromatiales bacterium]|nr:MAG: PA2779 family protein [Chromatiales bacterium]